jgi:Tfp pilus assembly protein PilV
MEVMIACAILFTATFGILALVSSSLRNARALTKSQVDVGMAAAQVYQLLRTNRTAELSISGDFGDDYPEYSWNAESEQFDTNGLLVVNIKVERRGHQGAWDETSILIFSPDSKSTGFGGIGRR